MMLTSPEWTERMAKAYEARLEQVRTQARDALAESGIKNGIVTVYSHHTTCAVITQEAAFDMSMTGLETLQQDLVDVFEKASKISSG